MGLRGPAPKPTVLKLAEGNPGKRRLNDREPKPSEVMPRCPAHLDKIARREWKRLSDILNRMRVLTEADYLALGNLCLAYSTLIQAQEKLNQTGLLIKTGSGYVQQSPLISIITANTQIINRLCQEFGLTPAARTRVQTVEAAPGIDPLEALLA